jgi:23S rRNA U2552 (ribose-2'-O)-methylase RlmE/FtsJ
MDAIEEQEKHLAYQSCLLAKATATTNVTATANVTSVTKCLKQIHVQKEFLNATKTKLDAYVVRRRRAELFAEFGTTNEKRIRQLTKDPELLKQLNDSYAYSTVSNTIYLMTFKSKVEETFNTTYCTNAWLKCYEILSKEKLIEYICKTNGSKDGISYFGNAELPGNFILAVHHYCKTVLSNSRKNFVLRWCANSYLDSISSTSTSDSNYYLDDMYGILKNNPDKWAMRVGGFNGDILEAKNVDRLVAFTNEQLSTNPSTSSGSASGSVDLYTSDAGISLEWDEFNQQEEIEFRLKLAEFLVGLKTLRENGCMVVKLYTIFESRTIKVLQVVSEQFEKAKIVKPMTSKPANSEVYFVGIGFKPDYDAIQKLFADFGNVADSDKSEPSYTFIDSIEIKPAFVASIGKIVKKIYIDQQVPEIERNLYYFTKYFHSFVGKIYLPYKPFRNLLDDVYNKYIKNKVEFYYDKFTKDYGLKPFIETAKIRSDIVVG